MGIVIDFAKAKKAQIKEVQEILKKDKENEILFKNIKRNLSKNKKIKSDNQKLYRDYKVDRKKTVRIFDNGIIWVLHNVE